MAARRMRLRRNGAGIKRFSLRLPEAVWAELADRSAAQGLSINTLLVRVVEAFLRRQGRPA